MQQSQAKTEQAETKDRASLSPQFPVVRISQADSRHMRKQLLSLMNTFSLEKSYDLSALVTSARAGGVAIPSLAADYDLRRLSAKQAYGIINDVATGLLLPEGELITLNFCERPIIVRGLINQARWERYEYLGQAIWYSDINLERHAPDSFAISVDNIALVDSRKTFTDNFRMYEQIRDMMKVPGLPIERLLQRLHGALQAEKVTANEYAHEFGIARLKFEEINHCRDHIFVEQLGLSRGDRWDRSREAYAFIRTDSTLAEVLRLKDLSARPDIVHAIIEYSAQLGGLVDELRLHTLAGRPGYAYIALLDFLLNLELRSVMAKRLRPESSHYGKASQLFGIALQGLGFEDADALTDYLERGPSHPGAHSEAIARELRAGFLLNDDERAAVIAQRGQPR